MAIRKSVLMLTNTGTQWNVIGEPVKADSYYGYTDGIHTVQVIYQNFVGGFGLQGTLSLNPAPEDWFWISLNPNGSTGSPYMTFPQCITSPTGSNGGDTGSFATTFIGNFVFLRAVMTREFMMQDPNAIKWDSWQYGQIDKVLLSL